MGNDRKIGLITSTPFKYSETFFKADCSVWQELGYEVKLLFTQKPGQNFTKPDFPYALPLTPLSSHKLKRFFQIVYFIFQLPLTPIKPLIRFIKTEYQEGTPFRTILARLYTNQHFLKNAEIDLLIFGYGSLAITRENIGNAIQAASIVSFKGADISIFPLQFDNNVYQKLFQKPFAFYFVSNGLMEKARQYGFSKPNKTKILPAYIDPQKIPGHKTSQSITNPFKILNVGRLHWIKGQMYLIQAVQRLLKRNIPVQLTILGNGENYERLLLAIQEIGLADNVTITDKVDHQTVLRMMAESDLLVHPSLSEGTPNVVLEAQYIGLPCVVTNWQGVDELIRDNWNGWIVPKRAPEQLAHKLAEVYQLGEDDRKKIAQNALANVQANFIKPQRKKQFQNFFNEVLAAE